MKYKTLLLTLLSIPYSSASADINGAEPSCGCQRIYTNTPAACDQRLKDCLDQIQIPIFFDPSIYQQFMFCYEEDLFCRESYTEICELVPNVPPPPPEEPPPGLYSPPSGENSSPTSSPSMSPSPTSSMIPYVIHKKALGVVP